MIELDVKTEPSTIRVAYPSSAPRLMTRGSVASAEPRSSEIPDRYEVLDLLEPGGMGSVYLCFDRVAHERVAVKIPTRDPDDESVSRNALIAEIRALGLMHHENIVALREANDSGELVYLVADFVPGRSLSEWQGRDMTFSMLWPVVDQLLSALAHAHERGVVHGDLKPANILVEETLRGVRVRVIDFGLSWHFRHSLELGCESQHLLLGPPPGSGTVGYMAPEQALGESEVSARTDLYSLGCVLYRLVSGVRPKTTPGSAYNFRSIRVPPRPDMTCPGTPDAVIDLMMQLLSVDPTERPASAALVRQLWQRWQPAERAATRRVA